MTKHIFIIENMSCAHCEAMITNALHDAGVSCEIDLQNKTVSVERDGNIVTNARRIITSLGYIIM